MNGLASDLAMSIVDSGHIYAMGLASSSLTPSARLSEILGGLNQVLCFGVSSLRGGGGGSSRIAPGKKEGFSSELSTPGGFHEKCCGTGRLGGCYK